VRRRTLTARLRDERGSSLIEMLLSLGLVAMVVAIGVQGFG
jgi:Flp pilus assembly pilin Flp